MMRMSEGESMLWIAGVCTLMTAVACALCSVYLWMYDVSVAAQFRFPGRGYDYSIRFSGRCP